MTWNEKPYHSLDYEMKQHFGAKIYKIALDGGMTCPNRDGSLDTRGCIFCSAGGSGEFAEPLFSGSDAQFSSEIYPEMQKTRLTQYVHSQIEHAASRIRHKLGSAPAGYIAYFQSYTNTYAPVSYLRSLYTAAIRHPYVQILSVATRPDCLPDEVLKLCAELNQIKPVWLELGLQTIHDDTAAWMRRGYDLACFEDALSRLRGCGLEAIVHVILGLPSETRQKMLDTVRYLARQDIQGIKLHLLHILSGTDLAAQYQQSPFPVLTMDEYVDLVIDCIALLPPHIVIHRLTGDGPKRLLLAPLWSADKRRVLNTLTRRFRERGITQGCACLSGNR